MSTMVPMYGFGGGSGGAGASLTVNAQAGCTVTISKDGKTKTKTAGADGVAVFNGLATGTWAVTITDGEQTAQKTVTITADYSTAITFFAATIHVTYPAGSTCTATDGVTTLTAPDTSGTWDCVVPNAAVWTVSLDSGLAETVDVTTSGETYTVDKWYIFSKGEVKAGGSWNSTISGGYIVQDISIPKNGTRKIFTHSDPVNVSGCTKATFVIKSSAPVYSNTEVGIYRESGYAANITPIAFADIGIYETNTDTELSFTIPSGTTECYFGFGINRQGTGSATTTLRVKSILVE